MLKRRLSSSSSSKRSIKACRNSFEPLSPRRKSLRERFYSCTPFFWFSGERWRQRLSFDSTGDHLIYDSLDPFAWLRRREENVHGRPIQGDRRVSSLFVLSRLVASLSVASRLVESSLIVSRKSRRGKRKNASRAVVVVVCFGKRNSVSSGVSFPREESIL